MFGLITEQGVRAPQFPHLNIIFVIMRKDRGIEGAYIHRRSVVSSTRGLEKPTVPAQLTSQTDHVHQNEPSCFEGKGLSYQILIWIILLFCSRMLHLLFTFQASWIFWNTKVGKCSLKCALCYWTERIAQTCPIWPSITESHTTDLLQSKAIQLKPVDSLTEKQTGCPLAALRSQQLISHMIDT